MRNSSVSPRFLTYAPQNGIVITISNLRAGGKRQWVDAARCSSSQCSYY